MDRVQYVLVGLPLFLFFSDIISLFTTSPPPPTATKPSHHHHHHQVDPVTVPDFPSQNPSAAIIGEHVATGNTININFCSSCSYKGTAGTMKNMLEIAFPGTEVVLANYPAPLPKRLLSKVVPVLQFGVIGVVIGGEQIFPMLGFVAPPSWFNSLRANKFGTIASTWLLGNALQSFLNSSGAFEVYFNGELVFSKLKEGRFPGEIELKDLISRKMPNSKLAAFQGEGDSVFDQAGMMQLDLPLF